MNGKKSRSINFYFCSQATTPAKSRASPRKGKPGPASKKKKVQDEEDEGQAETETNGAHPSPSVVRFLV